MYEKFLISLRDNQKRRKHSIAQMDSVFGQHGYQIFDAIDTRKFITYDKATDVWSMNKDHETAVRTEFMFRTRITDIVVEESLRKEDSWILMNPGGVGCTLSHLGVMKMFLKSRHSLAFIAEDDIEFLPETSEGAFDEIAEQLVTTEPMMALSFSYTNTGAQLYLQKDSVVPLSNDRALYRPFEEQVVYSTMGYFLNRAMAENLLANAFPVSFSPDWFHKFIAQGWLKHLWCVYPFLSQPSGFNSTIMLQDHRDPGGHNSLTGIAFHRAAEFCLKRQVPVIGNLVRKRREEKYAYNIVIV
mgnify:CR=1 FL=1